MHAREAHSERTIQLVVDHQAHSRNLPGVQLGSIEPRSPVLGNETRKGNVDGAPGIFLRILDSDSEEEIKQELEKS